MQPAFEKFDIELPADQRQGGEQCDQNCSDRRRHKHDLAEAKLTRLHHGRSGQSPGDRLRGLRQRHGGGRAGPHLTLNIDFATVHFYKFFDDARDQFQAARAMLICAGRMPRDVVAGEKQLAVALAVRPARCRSRCR